LRGSETFFNRVKQLEDLPSYVDVGAINFVDQNGTIVVNHGDAEVTYGAMKPITISGAVNGSISYDDYGKGTLVVEPGPDLVLQSQITQDIRPTGETDATLIPSESATRKYLDDLEDRKLDKSAYRIAYKGLFETAEALKAAYPSGVDGDFAMVTETHTTWAYESGQWVDTGSLEGISVTSINGKTGQEIMLTPEDVGAYSEEQIDTFLATLKTAAEAGLVLLRLFVENSDKAIQARQQARNLKKSLLILSKDVGQDTVVPIGQIVEQTGLGTTVEDWATLIVDNDGTLGITSAHDETTVTVRTLTTTVYGQDKPFLLGNVVAAAPDPAVTDLPATVAEGITRWNRTVAVGCYARVTGANKTTEYHVQAVSDTGVITWSMGIDINTSDYQEQSASTDAGKILIGGSAPGTYGANLDPNSFGAGIAAVAVNTANEYTDNAIATFAPYGNESFFFIVDAAVVIPTTWGQTITVPRNKLTVLRSSNESVAATTVVKGHWCIDRRGTWGLVETDDGTNVVIYSRCGYTPPVDWFGVNSNPQLLKMVPERGKLLSKIPNTVTLVAKEDLRHFFHRSVPLPVSVPTPNDSFVVIDYDGTIGTIQNSANLRDPVEVWTLAKGYQPLDSSDVRLYRTTGLFNAAYNTTLTVNRNTVIRSNSVGGLVPTGISLKAAYIYDREGSLGYINSETGTEAADTLQVIIIAKGAPSTDWHGVNANLQFLKIPPEGPRLTKTVGNNTAVEKTELKHFFDRNISFPVDRPTPDDTYVVIDADGTIGTIQSSSDGRNPVVVYTLGSSAAIAPVMPKALFSRTALSATIGGTVTIGLANFRIFHANGATPAVADFIPGSQFVYDANNRAGFVETFTPSSASNGSAVVRTMNSGGLLNL
jgi:hypothetical protein